MAAKETQKQRKRKPEKPDPVGGSEQKKKQKLGAPKAGSFKDTHKKKQPKPPASKRERRLLAKELTEARKKKRKRNYTLEQELARLWEKMRQRNITKEERSRLISESLQKMKGKIPEIATSHVSSRVLQTCVKYCSQAERESVFEELKPRFLSFACNTYAVHLLMKMLDASKKQLAEFVSFLRGHVASLLRHMVGSVVVEHVYQLGNATQKQEILMELYSTELQLFKDLASIKETRLLDIISRLRLQKHSVLRHMTKVIQPILEKGIVDHSIIHKLLVEYLSIADKTSAADVVKQFSGPLLVRMIHTRDGSRIGVLCVKHGTAKERKKIVKGLKGHVGKTAYDQHGSLVLSCIVATVDDTKLLTKIIIRELQAILKDLVLEKNSRRPLLQLLHPNCSRYFSPDDLATLGLSIASLSSEGELDVMSGMSSKVEDSSGKEGVSETERVPMVEDVENATAMAEEDENATAAVEDDKDLTLAVENDENAIADELHLTEGGKKDPSVRRRELLNDSGLAENLIDACRENAGELLRSNFGKDVIYEVARGGSDGILLPTMGDRLKTLHEAIASLAAVSKSEESETEHVLENFHSSRTIRKLILDCPAFATILWTTALEGKCQFWAQGHSSKVIRAFLECSDPEVRKLSKKELEALVEGGILEGLENEQEAADK